MLIDLWEGMLPNVASPFDSLSLRGDINSSGSEYCSEDWGKIGFQGRDPATDFRGMGVLGLIQLVHFVKFSPSEARKVLAISNHPRRYITVVHEC